MRKVIKKRHEKEFTAPVRSLIIEDLQTETRYKYLFRIFINSNAQDNRMDGYMEIPMKS